MAICISFRQERLVLTKHADYVISKNKMTTETLASSIRSLVANLFFYLILIMQEKEKLRLDKYLWAIRLFKTRSQAAEACDKGKVKYNGDGAKASKQVHVGDEYEVKTEARRWRIKVTGLLHNRQQYAEAIKYYLDITPADEIERLQFQSASFNTGKRQSKTGRPSKKQRRELGDFMAEE